MFLARPIRGVSSAKGKSASLSVLPKRRRVCSRKKKMIKVNTKQRLIVRVRGTTDILLGYLVKTSGSLVAVFERTKGLKRAATGIRIQRKMQRYDCGSFRVFVERSVLRNDFFTRQDPVFQIVARYASAC